MAVRNPPHPGGIVRRQCLDPLDLSVTEAAKGLVPRHRGFDRLISIYSRMGKFCGATSSSMLRGTPG